MAEPVTRVDAPAADPALIAELEQSLAAARLQQALICEALTRAAGYLDRHSDG